MCLFIGNSLLVELNSSLLVELNTKGNHHFGGSLVLSHILADSIPYCGWTKSNTQKGE